MSQIDLRYDIYLTLTREEFRIIGLALAGKLSRPALQRQAKELNVLLLKQAAAALTDYARVVSGAHVRATEVLTAERLSSLPAKDVDDEVFEEFESKIRDEL